MFGIKEFDLSESNEYRYTLLDNNLCYDFIVRDNDIHFLSSADTYKIFDPRLTSSDLIRLRCNFYDDTFTHFIMRTKPYFDKLKIVKDMEYDMVIIQDFTKELNLITNFKPLPIFDNITNIYIPNSNIITQFNKLKNGD